MRPERPLKAPDISIVIVNWNTRDLLHQCLESVSRTTEDEPAYHVEVIVIDNASADDSVAMVRSDFPTVRVIASDENTGFASGCNRGIRLSSAPYVLLLNPDTIVLPGAIARTARFMDESPGAGAATCRVLNHDRSDQVCHADFPSLTKIVVGGSSFRAAFHSVFLTKGFFRHAGLSRQERMERRQVDWVMGAFMMLRRTALADSGLLDESLFMYGEEADLCYRLHRRGWEIWYVPDGEITHLVGKSREQIETVQDIDWLLETRCYFFWKHFGRGRMLASCGVGTAAGLAKLGVYALLAALPFGDRRRRQVRAKRDQFRHEVAWYVRHRRRLLSSDGPMSVRSC